jgi:hypothetical protein
VGAEPSADLRHGQQRRETMMPAAKAPTNLMDESIVRSFGFGEMTPMSAVYGMLIAV